MLHVDLTLKYLKSNIIPVKYFTDRSKAVLLLWNFYVFVLSCVCYVFVRVCLYVLCGLLVEKGWPLGSRLWCLLWFCHFPIGILGQMWYLIVSIPDLCTLTYFIHFILLKYWVKKGFEVSKHGHEVIKLEYNLKLKIKCNDWLLAYRCPQAAQMAASSHSLRFILSLRMNL